MLTVLDRSGTPVASGYVSMSSTDGGRIVGCQSVTITGYPGTIDVPQAPTSSARQSAGGGADVTLDARTATSRIWISAPDG